MLQGASTATGTSFADSKPACVKHEEREVLACRHCRLVQFRTRTSLCRRCHKPLDGEVWNRTELDAAGVRSEPGASEVSDAVARAREVSAAGVSIISYRSPSFIVMSKMESHAPIASRVHGKPVRRNAAYKGSGQVRSVP